MPRAACRAICTSCGGHAIPKQFHLEYGYSCMGYEIAAGLGVKMAAPDREVFVLVGDGSYLMMAQEIVTSIQEGVRLIDPDPRQPRLRQHRRAVAVGRLRRLRHGVSLSQSRDRAARRRAAAGRSCRECRVARRARDSSVHARRSPRGDRDSAPRRPHDGHRDPGRSRAAGRRLRSLVGRADRRGLDDRGGADRASRVRARPNPGAQLPVTRIMLVRARF